MTFIAALRYDRISASTLLNEEGAFDGDVVEAQLAHETDEKKRRRRDGASLPRATRTRFAASTTGQRIGANACLMQHWANRLDRLRKGVTVPLRKSA